ncbi:hypothetical protein EYR40_001616 [Pleurotus pulmonarius]|nr:hypothetical protein EYR36_000025 [Pleurotus pulmonarius]KAF4604435.1 hypothetical protein EYR38_004857 [Pleurotus pulmonarius]KAF4609263.1 hypothetical protein EYR40_001616 [Pleurotus pulmonarius]
MAMQDSVNYAYHQRFPHDRRLLKLAVWASFLGSIGLTAILVVYAWQLIINNDYKGKEYKVITAITGFLGMNSQILFAWRIFEISRKRWLFLIICGLALSGVAILIIDRNYIIWPGIGIACDILVTTSMVLLLRRALRDALFKKTRQRISAVLAFTIETGLLTTLLLVPQLALQIQGPSMANEYMLYSSWLLASLNARSSKVDDGSVVIHTSSDLPYTRSDDPYPDPAPSQQGEGILVIAAIHGDHGGFRPFETSNGQPK